MKQKKYPILIFVILFLITGLFLRADASESFFLDKITDRSSFLLGAYFTQTEMGEKQSQESINVLRSRSGIPKGMQGVSVLVEEIRTPIAKYGLTSNILLTDIELQLRQHGIKPYSQQEVDQIFSDSQRIQLHANEQFQKFISLSNSIKDQSDEQFLLSVREWIKQGEPHAPSSQILTLYVNVNTAVDEEYKVTAYAIDIRLYDSPYLWNTSSVGMIHLSKVSDIRGHVKDHINNFINAYLATNPRTSQATSVKKGVIKGTSYSEGGKSNALIGTEFVSEGDTIGNIKVIKINKNSVEFEKDGKRWTQTIGESPGPQWQ